MLVFVCSLDLCVGNTYIYVCSCSILTDMCILAYICIYQHILTYTYNTNIYVYMFIYIHTYRYVHIWSVHANTNNTYRYYHIRYKHWLLWAMSHPSLDFEPIPPSWSTQRTHRKKIPIKSNGKSSRYLFEYELRMLLGVFSTCWAKNYERSEGWI
jgi:hypothetical protein